jgi:hypothetical protein
MDEISFEPKGVEKRKFSEKNIVKTEKLIIRECTIIVYLIPSNYQKNKIKSNYNKRVKNKLFLISEFFHKQSYNPIFLSATATNGNQNNLTHKIGAF